MFVVVGLFPIAFTAVISFMDWDLVRNSGKFIGFDQYVWILRPAAVLDGAAQHLQHLPALERAAARSLAIFIAAMLDRNIRPKTFWRMGVLAAVRDGARRRRPHLQQHVRRQLRPREHVPAPTSACSPIQWHKDAFWSHIAIATMVNFRWTGYNTLILLAAMQAVPRDYYEAATRRRRGRVPPVLAASRCRRCARRSSS